MVSIRTHQKCGWILDLECETFFCDFRANPMNIEQGEQIGYVLITGFCWHWLKYDNVEASMLLKRNKMRFACEQYESAPQRTYTRWVCGCLNEKYKSLL